MQFIDLKAQYKTIQDSIQNRINRVLDHGQYILGPEVEELEKKLAEYVGVKHAIANSNGTDALVIALMALGIGKGDEVITTPFTFIATGEMIAHAGATPVFVDIDPKTYNMDPKLLEKAITSKTKAIMPVSLYGLCADLDAINAIAKKHNLPVIEDGAQSFGGSYKKRRSCSMTTIATTSFFPAKPLGCYGDGGALFTNDDQLAKVIKEIRNHGQDRRYHHVRIGINGRMDTLQAAILLSKLEIFEKEEELRNIAAERYFKGLKGVVTAYEPAENYRSIYAQFTIEVDNREAFIARMQEQGVPTSVHYPIPLHFQPVFEYLKIPKGTFPHSERASERVVSLPMHPYLDETTQNKVIAAVKASLK